MTANTAEWFTLLAEECARTSTGKVAERLGYSRTAISLILNGKYLGKPDKIAKAVIRVLQASVACPFTGADVEKAVCREKSASRAPTHNPQAMAQWSACQRCQNNCKKEVEQ